MAGHTKKKSKKKKSKKNTHAETAVMPAGSFEISRVRLFNDMSPFKKAAVGDEVEMVVKGKLIESSMDRDMFEGPEKLRQEFKVSSVKMAGSSRRRKKPTA